MTFTLHRYVFRELVKVFIPATLALTVILSLGSIIRPIQEYGVGPRQVVHILGYFVPISLTFVLPIAALFACAFVYGRLACFNELDACKASGISLLTMVYPGFILALIVAITNLILSFYVMPAFVQRTQKSLKADAQKILFQNIQQDGYYEASAGKGKTFLVHADQADPESGVLSGVVITKIVENNLEDIIVAGQSRLKFNIRDKMNEVKVDAYNTYEMRVGDEAGMSVEKISLVHEFRSFFEDNIQFKKIDKLQEIRANPMAFPPIENLAYDAYAQLIIELVANDIIDTFTGENTFYRLGCGDKFIEFKAKECRLSGEEQIELAKDVVVRDFTKKSIKTYNCQKAILQIEGYKKAPNLAMEMESALDESGNIIHKQIIYGLLIPPNIENILSKHMISQISDDQNILNTVSSGAVSEILGGEAGEKLKERQNNLNSKIFKTMLSITAEINSRLVFGIGCVPMILIGIGLGIFKKDGHLLSAFGASVVPAMLLIICIMMGKNLIKNKSVEAFTAVLLMWFGIVVLWFVAGVVYRKLLRN